MDIAERMNIVREGLEAGLDDRPIALMIYEYKTAADEIERLRKERDDLEAEVRRLMIIAKNEINTIREERDELLALLERYRNETPVGHQPHMICHVVDAAISRVKGAE